MRRPRSSSYGDGLLFAHTISEVLDLVAFVLVFAGAIVRVVEPQRRAVAVEPGRP